MPERMCWVDCPSEPVSQRSFAELSSGASGGRYPGGGVEPVPKKKFDISLRRNVRALGSSVERRYSLMIMVCRLSQFCQASFETSSKIR